MLTFADKGGITVSLNTDTSIQMTAIIRQHSLNLTAGFEPDKDMMIESVNLMEL